MNQFEWYEPRSLPEAAGAATATVADAMSAASADGSILKAGGIDLLDLMKENLVAPRRIVNLRDVPGLDTIVEVQDGGLRIGALVTLAALARHPSVRQGYAALAAAAEGSGSPQLRNVATLAGNILQRPRCWYFRSANFHCRRKGGIHCFALPGENQYHAIFDNDLCPIVHPSTAATALVAFGASVELVDAVGHQRRLALEDFFVSPDKDVGRENDLHPGEILTAICLPPVPATKGSVHLKQSEKASFDWPLADVAVVLDLAPDGMCQGARIVLGAAAPVPHRAHAAETFLIGCSIDDKTARGAARVALMGANPLAKNGYKLPIFMALIYRALLAAASETRSKERDP